ncbi:response regulator [Pseudonocardia oroxyli]|uniref:Response regulator receiver domain-containing protein n=1 Tax=Pseudonocardia oroxyli TaxID=366584 RepID=A0A1G8BUR5_PSEOR|nr:response regulator [Pseudonocardia oroxyli]SDH36868.1 Response regulator receiver domain-containing protein [Pseudonocardia oroxyli]
MDIASVVVQGLGVLVWPAVVAFVLWTFRTPLGTLLTSGTVSVKAGGVQISTAARAAAATALQSAAQDKATPLAPEAARSRVDADADALAARPTPPRVLWVDDRPSGNRFECAALTRLGMVVEQAVSTDAALNAVLRSAPFDVIVSDMARPESSTAGYDLLDRLRADGVRTPFVLYSGSADPAHDDEAVAHGALGSTNDPAVLLELIAQALLRQPPPGAGG